MFVNQIFNGGIRALMDWDPTLFDGMSLPEDEDQNPVVDLQDVVDAILFEYGDAPLFCPDPNVMKYYITSWSKRRLPLWERFVKAVTAEYDPLENYDRHEKYDVDFTPGAIYEQLVSADNASTYQPERQSKGMGGKDNTHNEGRIHGNIGVTTSQQMLASELDLIGRLDIIEMIADDWHQEFNLMMYN